MFTCESLPTYCKKSARKNFCALAVRAVAIPNVATDSDSIVAIKKKDARLVSCFLVFILDRIAPENRMNYLYRLELNSSTTFSKKMMTHQWRYLLIITKKAGQ